MELVPAQVVASLLELAQGDQRLDRVGPYGRRRLVLPSASSRRGRSRRYASGSLEIAERELEPSEHTEDREREEFVSHRSSCGKSLLRGYARLLDQTKVRLDEGPDTPDHRAVCLLGLRVQLVREGGMMQGPLPVSCEPFELGQPPEDLCAGAVVAARCGVRLQLFEERTGPVELTRTHQNTGERDAWALEVLEREPVALLDLHTALDQARGELGGDVSAWVTRVIATARSVASSKRSALWSAARASASAAPTSPSNMCAQLR